MLVNFVGPFAYSFAVEQRSRRNSRSQQLADLLDPEAPGFLERHQSARRYRFYPATGLAKRMLGA